MASRKNKEEATCGTEGTQRGGTGRPKEIEQAAGVSNSAVSARKRDGSLVSESC